MSRHAVVAACFVAASLTGCSLDASPDSAEEGIAMARSPLSRDMAPNVAPADAAALRDGNTAFALDLYRTLTSEPSAAQRNLFFSPHSISTALAMTYAGARGETEAEMAAALHFTLPQDRLHAAFNALDLALESRGQGQKAADGKEPFRLRTTSSLWGAPQLDFETPFLDALATNYGAGVRLMDFARDPEAARGTINGWATRKTEGRIGELLPARSVGSDTRFVLVNAIYFNAAWATQFAEGATSKAVFHGAGGDVEADMMALSGAFRYAKGEGYEAVSLPYAGDELSFVAILPADLAAFEASLTPELVATLPGDAATPLQLGLPRFEIDGASVSLKEALAARGMTKAFAAGADFSGITKTEALHLSNVFHQAFVKVDEQGTEAAAATAVVGTRKAALPSEVTLTFDRPFVFFVRDDATGAVLFLGRVQTL